ncbi:MAG: 4Fe-4S binding protein [Dehalococcoidia bacterium]|nr:4Fe-4S binding protein [Dehalococcoidia bacterium]
MLLASEVKQAAFAAGADLVGIGSAESMAKVPGYSATELLPDAKSYIVMAKRALNGFIMGGKGRNLTWGMTYLNFKMNEICYEVTKYIEDRGNVALPSFFVYQTFVGPRSEYFNAILDTKWFSYIIAGAQAGVGEVGMNGLLLTPEFGPKVRLTAVITDAVITPDPKTKGDLCPGISCNLCAEACPVGAISVDGVDKPKCHGYNDAHQEVLGYSYCGMCIRACPAGKR